MDADLRRQLGRSVGERDERPLGEPEPLVDRGHRRLDVGGGQVAQGRAGSPGQSRAAPAPGSSLPSPGRCRRSTPPRASTTSSSSATRSSSTTPWRRSRSDPRRAAGVPNDRRQRAAPCRGLGVEAARPGRRCPAGRAAAAPGPGDHRPGAPVRDEAPSATSSRPSRATRRRLRSASRRPRSLAIAADEREHAEIWKRLDDGVADPGRGRRCRGRAPSSAVAGCDRSRRALAPDRSVGHAAGGHLRGERRARQQHQSRDGRRRRGSSGRARGSSCSPGSPACSPGHSAWPPASTSRCSRSASCTSARSPSSGPSSRRCPRRSRPSWPRSTGRRASPRAEAEAIAAAAVRRSRARPRHAHPRGARARPGRARLAVGRRRRVVRGVRGRRRHPGRPVPADRGRHDGDRGQPRAQPRRRCSPSASASAC